MENTGKQFRKRNAILAYLLQTREHPTADQIYEALRKDNSDISMASVYRNLTWFKEQGQIISLGTVSGVERFDARTEPHIHFACRRCGRVEDVPDAEIPGQLQSDAERRLHCRVLSAQLMLSGICESCNQKNYV